MTPAAICSGFDDQGQNCPPEYSPERPCPRGCTSVPSGTATTTDDSVSYNWTTANVEEYLCSQSDMDVAGSSIACAQGQYPAAENPGGALDAELACPDGQTIRCLPFASYGLVRPSRLGVSNCDRHMYWYRRLAFLLRRICDE